MSRRRFPGWTTRPLSARTAGHGKLWTALAWLRLSKTPSSRSSTATSGRNEAVQLTISKRHVCVVYSSEMTCYYSLLERICVHRKGKHHFSGGIQNDESMADSREL